MQSNISKNSGISPSLLQQLKIKYQIYGFLWTIRLTLQFIFRKIYFEYLQQSYSQYGEDLIISKYLKSRKIFYVDIGANHPIKFNNTYCFYKSGSRGINIEPNTQLLHQISTARPKDTNLNIGISNKPGLLDFYQMYPDVNSTFSYHQYLHNLSRQSILVAINKVEVKTMESVLDQYLPTSQSIDLLSIDTEGHDYQVLKSNNWHKYQPTIICIETQTTKLAHRFLTKLGYYLINKTAINSLYVKKSSSILPRPTSLRT